MVHTRARSRTAGEDAAAAEGARLKPGHARLEARLGRGAALLVRELLLGGERHVEQHLRKQQNDGQCTEQTQRQPHVFNVRESTCGGMIIMLGVTPYRDMRYLHSSTALSKPSCSF